MSEGWEDCPVLPVGWKRREVYRRSGATIGKSDTYYMSPTAERFRSKVELVKYFGDALDLTYFDFKKGIILPPDAKIRKSVKRLSTSSCEVEEERADHCQTPRKKAKVLHFPNPADVKTEKVFEAEGLASAPLDTLIVCCEDCQQWVPGVLFSPRKRRFRFYCAECRAKRRELSRKLNYYKRHGCGECEGCAVPEDCGVCRGCVVRNSENGKNWKCVRRWCYKLKEIKAEALCRKNSGEPKKKVKTHLHGVTKATHRAEATDVTSEDKGGTQCKVPTKKVKRDQGVEKKLLKKVKARPARQEQDVEQEKPVLKSSPSVQEELASDSPHTPVQLFTPMSLLMPEDFVYYYNVNSEFLLKNSRTRRNNRSCGECEACLRPTDCGACDFCKDKAKFGGANTLRQKCRWKQCLCFASVVTAEEEVHSGPASPEGRQEVAVGEQVVPSPAKDSAVSGESPCRSPQRRSPSTDQALNLTKFLSAMTPFLKGSSSSEAHDRPSVIRETSEWHFSSEQRRPVETTVLQSSTVSAPAQREPPEPEHVPTTMVLQEGKSERVPPTLRSVSPVIKKREHQEQPSSRKRLSCCTEETGLNGNCSQRLSPRIKEERIGSMSSYREPISPERPAEQASRTPGIPCNSRIVRRESPEQSPGYGRSPPAAITQIFSLGSPYMMMNLEPLLRNFMQDLMLLPLPASWVVCSSLGPDVQLLQLSRKSPVWDAVVQIQPGFFFQVVVRGLAVPLGHRLYRSHPAQLTTVDDVVDLISDLETYRVCSGYPQLRSLKSPPPAMAALLPRERSSFCEVLVEKERCFHCAATI